MSIHRHLADRLQYVQARSFGPARFFDAVETNPGALVSRSERLAYGEVPPAAGFLLTPCQRNAEVDAEEGKR